MYAAAILCVGMYLDGSECSRRGLAGLLSHDRCFPKNNSIHTFQNIAHPNVLC